MIWFISGPMSGHDDFNYPAFHEAGDYLKKHGHRFLSPAHGRFGTPRQAPAPHEVKPWEYYMRQSLKQLLFCDVILMLPGWENSMGATMEKNIAQDLKMPIEYWKGKSNG